MNAYFGNRRVKVVGDERSMVERILDCLFKKKAIVNCDKDVYLHRWYIIRTKPFALFLHKFVRSDEDRALHDHPWPFLVIPIWRGYMEWHECPICQAFKKLNDFTCVHPEKTRVYPILGTRLRPATYRHRVELFDRGVSEHTEAICGRKINPFKPSWSIFFRFREFREWGFCMPEGWIQWNKFWQDKCE